MRTKTLTMDKNEVRFLFSIYNISKKHCISLLLEKLHFDLHVLKSHHIGRALTRETGSGTQIEQIGQRNGYQATLRPWRQFSLKRNKCSHYSFNCFLQNFENKNGRACGCEMESAGLENRTKVWHRCFDWKLERRETSGRLKVSLW